MSDAVRTEEVSPSEWMRVLRVLPGRLYENDPCWVGIPEIWQRSRLNIEGAFFRDATLVVFAAYRGPELVGTISVLRDRHFAADPQQKLAWFGHFECLDDEAVADALIAAAVERARAWGAHVLRGSRDLSRFEYVGITVEGHDRLPPMLQGQHKSWYPRMLEARGFTAHHDVLAYERPLSDASGQAMPIPAALQRKADECRVAGLTVRRLRYRRMESDLRAAHRVLDEAYASVPDIQPMPWSTFSVMGRAIALLSKRDLIQLAFVGDRPVAFSMCMPEIHESWAHARGSLTPMGTLRALAAWRHTRTAAFKLIGVVPDLRGSGVHARMVVAVVEGAQRAGFTRMDGSVIDERNGPMRGVVEGAGMQVYRRYRLFERAL